jgi:hypothetical protein
VITISGELELGDEKRFANMAVNISHAVVAFDSPGGNLVAGIEIGRAIRLKDFSTAVPANATCASACAVAWLGGRQRLMGANARIGFHAAYLVQDGKAETTGVGNALVGAYLNQLGLPERAIIYITMSSPETVNWLDRTEARSVGIDVTALEQESRPQPATEPALPRAPVETSPAQRAALLVEAPKEIDKTKTYVGTVVWRLESVSKGEGQPLATVVRADIDIPDANLKGSMVLQKNLDPTLPATHTIELRFMLGSGSALRSIQGINTPQIRAQGMPDGEPLSGVPVRIAQNWFLVGLSQSDADRNRNADLLNKNAWIDVPLLLANKKLAKITFEKGASGNKAIADAYAAWRP